MQSHNGTERIFPRQAVFLRQNPNGSVPEDADSEKIHIFYVRRKADQGEPYAPLALLFADADAAIIQDTY